jgi:hypothetical protein
LARLSVTSPRHTDIPVTMPAFAKRFEGTTRVPFVDAGTGTADDFSAMDARGKSVLIEAASLSALGEQVK